MPYAIMHRILHSRAFSAALCPANVSCCFSARDDTPRSCDNTQHQLPREGWGAEDLRTHHSDRTHSAAANRVRESSTHVPYNSVDAYDITFENVAGKLATIRDAAAADGSYGPAVNAEIARAKLGGLMVDRKEVRFGKIDSMSREELENRLKQLMEENQIRSIDGEARIIEDEDDNTKDKRLSGRK